MKSRTLFFIGLALSQEVICLEASASPQYGIRSGEQTRQTTHYLAEEPRAGFVTVGYADPYQPMDKAESFVLPKANRSDKPQAISCQIDRYLEAGETLIICFDAAKDSLRVICPERERLINNLALRAMDRAPEWLRNDLMNVFSKMGEAQQTKWAQTILDTHHPYVDEVAFSIAHSSPQCLMSQYGSPDLFLHNAELIYANDQSLAYVQVVDYGSPESDRNYYSTTAYRTIRMLDTLEVEAPRDIYYWYLVHPRITGEIPAYIDPEIVESNYSHQNNIVSSGQGLFWRDFLFNHADPGYTSLKQTLKDSRVVWVDPPLSFARNLAVDAVNRWIQASMTFTSNEERPHQPVRIYRKHIGRCGEYSDLGNAALRAALIPARSISTASTDHTWNEFWDQEWVHFGDDAINNPMLYENGWGKIFGSVFETRSDGSLTSVTHTYSVNCATLNLYVLDQLGRPVDGAKVWLYTKPILDTDQEFDNYGVTDNDGEVTFVVGTQRSYFVRTSSYLGDEPADPNARRAIPGKLSTGDEKNFSLTVPGTLPVIEASATSGPVVAQAESHVEIEFAVPDQVIHGDMLGDDLRAGGQFYRNENNGTVDFYVMNQANCSKLESGEKFEFYQNLPDVSHGSLALDLPKDESTYLVFRNSHANNFQHVSASVKLYRSHSDKYVNLNLVQNSPNPASDHTVIKYQLPQQTNVEITIYNFLGQKIRTLEKGFRYADEYPVEWDCKDETGARVAAGIYFYRIQTDYGSTVRKMVVVR